MGPHPHALQRVQPRALANCIADGEVPLPGQGDLAEERPANAQRIGDLVVPCPPAKVVEHGRRRHGVLAELLSGEEVGEQLGEHQQLVGVRKGGISDRDPLVQLKRRVFRRASGRRYARRAGGSSSARCTARHTARRHSSCNGNSRAAARSHRPGRSRCPNRRSRRCGPTPDRRPQPPSPWPPAAHGTAGRRPSSRCRCCRRSSWRSDGLRRARAACRRTARGCRAPCSRRSPSLGSSTRPFAHRSRPVTGCRLPPAAPWSVTGWSSRSARPGGSRWPWTPRPRAGRAPAMATSPPARCRGCR